MKIIAIDHGGAALRAARLIAATRTRPPVIVEPRTPATQLEIAAHWLEELATTSDQKDNLLRVARECKAVAFREGK